MTYTKEIFELSAPYANMYQGNSPKMLCVCSVGMLRSPTAAVVGNRLGFNTRSCGSSSIDALIPISANLVYWADYIFFMNKENLLEAQWLFSKHQEVLDELNGKAVVWNIPDTYEYMNPELVSILEETLKSYIS